MSDPRPDIHRRTLSDQQARRTALVIAAAANDMLGTPRAYGEALTGTGIYVVGRLACQHTVPGEIGTAMGAVLRQILYDGIFSGHPFANLDPRLPARFPIKFDAASFPVNITE